MVLEVGHRVKKVDPINDPKIKKMLEKKDVKGLASVLRDKNVNLKQEAIAALGELGPEAKDWDVLFVLCNLADDNNLYEYVITALGEIGEIGNETIVADRLLGILSKCDSRRFVTIMALAKIGDPRAIDAIIPFLVDQDEYVAVSAVWGLCELKGNKVIKVLRETAINARDSMVGEAAEEVLEKLEKRKWWKIQIN